ncbi:hypothetical protein [Viscerimonas tarda]
MFQLKYWDKDNKKRATHPRRGDFHQGKCMKIFSAAVTNEIPPFGRNDSPMGGLRE